MKTDERVISIVGFAFLISAVVAPFVGWIFVSQDMAIVFTMVAVLLGLVFGFLGRSYLLGKVALIGSLILIVIGTVNYFRFLSYRGLRPLAAQSRTYHEPKLWLSLPMKLTFRNPTNDKT